jgi:hypothetical protein
MPIDAGTSNAPRTSASSSATTTAAGSRVPSPRPASDAAVATPMSPPDGATSTHTDQEVDDSDAGAGVGKSDAGTAPVRPDAGSVAEPKTGTNAASETLPRQFASAVEAVFAGAGGVARGSNAEWKRWRNMARHSDRLTPEIVTPALEALASSAVCFARVSQCVNVCVVIEQDCEPCVEDAGCHAALRQVCGAFPGGFCTF